jgi:hypothetical protein
VSARTVVRDTVSRPMKHCIIYHNRKSNVVHAVAVELAHSVNHGSKTVNVVQMEIMQQSHDVKRRTCLVVPEVATPTGINGLC